ncbi:MFS transporter [Endozoicomonas numazuensis]|uniref:Major facilitator superfamily (MFS) profile domain-containing protein n=1 Tax=Endozoicomonas numazuensis TaxID=1137799 RepID=A0A081NFT8_9GAMM|nr:MFS transporter [Endozoicomonas numazuensis]KEQ17311.1 hypothetical protein GZ78_15990 [Endozoicomonas numazuensis]
MISSKAIGGESFNASLLLFLSSVFLGILAETFIIFSIPLIVLELTGSASYAGLAFMVEWIPAILMYPIAGIIVDKLGAKMSLALSALLRCIVIVAVTICLFEFEEYTLHIVLVCSFLLSFMLPFSRMGAEKLVSALKELKNVSVLHSYVQSSELLAWTLGPALAAYASTLLKLEEILGLAGLLFFVGLISISLYKDMEITIDKEDKEDKEDKGVGLFFGVSYVWSNKALFALAINNCIANFMFAVVLSSHAAIVTEVFKLDDGYYGLLNFIGGVFGFLNLALVPYLIREMKMLSFSITGLGMIGIGFLILSIAEGYMLYVVGFSMSIIGITLYNIFNRTLRTTIIEQEVVGQVMGFFYLLNIIMLPIGGGAVYLFADTFGNQPIIMVVTLILTPVCIFLSLKANQGFWNSEAVKQ